MITSIEDCDDAAAADESRASSHEDKVAGAAHCLLDLRRIDMEYRIRAVCLPTADARVTALKRLKSAEGEVDTNNTSTHISQVSYYRSRQSNDRCSSFRPSSGVDSPTRLNLRYGDNVDPVSLRKPSAHWRDGCSMWDLKFVDVRRLGKVDQFLSISGFACLAGERASRLLACRPSRPIKPKLVRGELCMQFCESCSGELHQRLFNLHLPSVHSRLTLHRLSLLSGSIPFRLGRTPTSSVETPPSSRV